MNLRRSSHSEFSCIRCELYIKFQTIIYHDYFAQLRCVAAAIATIWRGFGVAGTSQEVCDVKHTLSGKGLNCILLLVCNRFGQCIFIAQYIFTRRGLEEKRNDKSRRYPSEPCLSNNATQCAQIYFLNSIQRVWLSRHKRVSNLFVISLFFISANIITLACLVKWTYFASRYNLFMCNGHTSPQGTIFSSEWTRS